MAMPRRKPPRDEKLNGQDADAIDLNAAPRVAQALRLRRLGYTYEEIAHRCGYKTEAGARHAVKKANDRIVRDESRALVGWQLDMLDAALRVVMERIIANNKESLWAVDRLAPLLKRQAELMGLDVKPDQLQAQAQMVVIGIPQDVLEAV